MEKLPLDTTREELLHILQKRGITDHAVLAAFQTVPREKFVPAPFARKAYNDVALPIGLDQTISQPFTVAYMTQKLELQPGMKVLEIGTGSGYQAAILAAMGVRVFSIERHLGLFERAIKILDEIGAQVECRYGDGSTGLVQAAPFDRIIVTAGAPAVPPALLAQLRVGGKLIIPVGDSQEQYMTIIDRTSESDFKTSQSAFPFTFVPLRGEQGWDRLDIWRS